VPPVPVNRVTPDYPETAAPAGVGGKVKLELAVDDKGFVTAAKILSEEPLGFGFGDAALSAGRRWTFQPGKPGTFRITMNFAPSDRAAIDFANLPQARPVSRVQPHYPEAAGRAGVNGSARIAVSIASDGTVAQTWVALEAPTGYGFGKAADQAVRNWKFAPGAPGLYVVEVHFQITDEPAGVHWADLKPLPEPIHRVAIRPPRAAAGHVRLAVSLADDGSVAEAAIVTEEPAGFGKAAREAVLLWRFEPGHAGVYRLNLSITATPVKRTGKPGEPQNRSFAAHHYFP